MPTNTDTVPADVWEQLEIGIEIAHHEAKVAENLLNNEFPEADGNRAFGFTLDIIPWIPVALAPLIFFYQPTLDHIFYYLANPIVESHTHALRSPEEMWYAVAASFLLWFNCSLLAYMDLCYRSHTGVLYKQIFGNVYMASEDPLITLQRQNHVKRAAQFLLWPPTILTAILMVYTFKHFGRTLNICYAYTIILSSNNTIRSWEIFIRVSTLSIIMSNMLHCWEGKYRVTDNGYMTYGSFCILPLFGLILRWSFLKFVTRMPFSVIFTKMCTVYIHRTLFMKWYFANAPRELDAAHTLFYMETIGTFLLLGLGWRTRRY